MNKGLVLGTVGLFAACVSMEVYAMGKKPQAPTPPQREYTQATPKRPVSFGEMHAIPFKVTDGKDMVDISKLSDLDELFRNSVASSSVFTGSKKDERLKGYANLVSFAYDTVGFGLKVGYAGDSTSYDGLGSLMGVHAGIGLKVSSMAMTMHIVDTQPDQMLEYNNVYVDQSMVNFNADVTCLLYTSRCV